MQVQANDGIRVLIFQDHGWWCAQCLEVDIGAQAENLKDLMHRLSLTMTVEEKVTTERNGAPFKGIDPAPAEFFQRWEDASGSFTPNEDGPLSKMKFAMAA